MQSRLIHQAKKIALTILALIAMVSMALWMSRDADNELFEEALLKAPGCSTVEDCEGLYTQCPLGCSHPVAKQAAPDLNALANKLVAQPSDSSKACAHDCQIAPPLECKVGRCAFASSDPDQ